MVINRANKLKDENGEKILKRTKTKTKNKIAIAIKIASPTPSLASAVEFLSQKSRSTISERRRPELMISRSKILYYI